MCQRSDRNEVKEGLIITHFTGGDKATEYEDDLILRIEFFFDLNPGLGFGIVHGLSPFYERC